MSGLASRKMQLVIVDDDPAVAKLVSRIVEGALGELVDVETFSDPREADAWIQLHCCDVLLSDVEMPYIEGLEMLRRAKARNAWTQVVFMTAHSTWDRIAEAIESGASDYLLKPLDHIEMVDVLKQQHVRFRRWQQALAGTVAAQRKA